MVWRAQATVGHVRWRADRGESAETRWRAVNGAHLVALVRAGAKFVDGRLAGRPEDQPGETPVEAAA